MNKRRTAFINILRNAVNSGQLPTRVTHTELTKFVQSNGLLSVVPLWFREDTCEFKIGRGKYDLSCLSDPGACSPPKVKPIAPAAVSPEIPAMREISPKAVLATHSLLSQESVIPAVDPDYIEWGNHADCATIIGSRTFYPVFITGLSGNGKTTMVQQACAKAKRECYRVNVTAQTDEDDLLGGFRLVNGETVWYDGPVVQSMKAGAVLLLDEIDLGSAPIMCLQPVLEGRGIFLKKINQFVSPMPGFQVFASANTKGKGDDTGAFSHTGILNEAFLDRFPVTLEQPYAPAVTERKILSKKMKTLGVNDSDFCSNLVKWAGAIRDTFMEGGTSEIITTRRLLSIVQAYSIFGDKSKAISMAIARFDGEVKSDFLKLYEKIDSDVAEANAADSIAAAESTMSVPNVSGNTCPF